MSNVQKKVLRTVHLNDPVMNTVSKVLCRVMLALTSSRPV